MKDKGRNLDVVGLIYKDSYYHPWCFPFIKSRPSAVLREMAEKYDLRCIACGKPLIEEGEKSHEDASKKAN